MTGVSVRKVDLAEPKSAAFFKELENTFERIRQKAFDLFEQRGGDQGKEMDDWLNAEAEFVYSPPAQLVEGKGNFEIHVIAPGFTSDQLKVNVLPDCIIVSGKTESKREGKEGTVYYSELSQRDLLRRFYLPNKIDPDQVHASLQDGILKIVAVKVTAATPKPADTEAVKETKAAVA